MQSPRPQQAQQFGSSFRAIRSLDCEYQVKANIYLCRLKNYLWCGNVRYEKLSHVERSNKGVQIISKWSSQIWLKTTHYIGLSDSRDHCHWEADALNAANSDPARIPHRAMESSQLQKEGRFYDSDQLLKTWPISVDNIRWESEKGCFLDHSFGWNVDNIDFSTGYLIFTICDTEHQYVWCGRGVAKTRGIALLLLQKFLLTLWVYPISDSNLNRFSTCFG